MCTCFVNPAKRVPSLVCCQTVMVNGDVKLMSSTNHNIWEDCHTLTTLYETIATKTWRGKKGEEKNETGNKTEEKSRRSMFFFHKGELISMTTLAREG